MSKPPKLPKLPHIDTSGKVKNTKPKRARQMKKTISIKGGSKKKKKPQTWKVPEAERDEYRRLVQKANRTIKSNLKYIEDNNIKDLHTIRDLVQFYQDKRKWARNKQGKAGKSPLSRSIEFKNEQEYKFYLRHLEDLTEHSTANKRAKGYRETIVDRLQRIASMNSVQLPDNKVPENIIEEVNKLNFAQLSNWFNIADPTEDMEVIQNGSKDYEGVSDYATFFDVTMKRLNWLKKSIK